MSSRNLSALLLFTLPLACADRYLASEPHMGTLVSITLYADSEAQAQRGFTSAFARIADLDAQFNDYSETSELSRVCSGTDDLSPDMRKVLSYAQKVAHETNGAFDITIGPLTRLWRKKQQPSAEVTRLVGFRKMQLESKPRCADKNMRLDAGGIAKGFAADEALVVLQSQGIAQALVALSGDLRIGAAPPGTNGWRVEFAGKVELLHNCAVSTSGDDYQFQEQKGVRSSHILDPRTGTPLTGARTVTVVATTAMEADALATAANVLGPKESASFEILRSVRLVWH